MKKILYGVLACCLLLFPCSVGAYTINDMNGYADRYIGYNDHGWGDIIGPSDLFSVWGMNVTFESGKLIVDVYTRYLDNIGAYGTLLGDLFISTNGWHPGGSPSDNYKYDGQSGSGELWEYATRLDGYDNANTKSGNLSLYSTSQGSIIFANATGYTFRDGQEVRYTPGAAPAVATGSWAILNPDDTDVDVLRFTINHNFDGVSNFGFHWSMTCANDVVEGSYTRVPVPEPGSLFLLGLGLLGIGVLRKKL